MKKLPKAPGHRVLVKLKDPEKTTKTGIVLISDSKLEAEKAAQYCGEVIDIGPDAYENSKKPWCQIGDVVQISKYSGVLVHVDDDSTLYRMINDVDVHAVYPKEDL